MATRTSELVKLVALCKLYQRDSFHLDGIVYEMLDKIIKLIPKDHDSLKAILERQLQDLQVLKVQMMEYRQQLSQYAKHHDEEKNAMVAKSMGSKEEQAKDGN